MHVLVTFILIKFQNINHYKHTSIHLFQNVNRCCHFVYFCSTTCFPYFVILKIVKWEYCILWSASKVWLGKPSWRFKTAFHYSTIFLLSYYHLYFIFQPPVFPPFHILTICLLLISAGCLFSIHLNRLAKALKHIFGCYDTWTYTRLKPSRRVRLENELVPLGIRCIQGSYLLLKNVHTSSAGWYGELGYERPQRDTIRYTHSCTMQNGFRKQNFLDIMSKWALSPRWVPDIVNTRRRPPLQLVHYLLLFIFVWQDVGTFSFQPLQSYEFYVRFLSTWMVF